MRWRYVVASVLLVAAVVTGVWLVFFSAMLSVSKVEVAGDEVLSDQRVLKVAAVPEGEQLAFVDLPTRRAGSRRCSEVK